MTIFEGSSAQSISAGYSSPRIDSSHVGRLLAACGLALTLAVAAPATHAAEPPPRGPDPKIPFEEARALMRAGRFAEAARKLEESVAIRVTPGAFLNLGDCYEKLGRDASAVDAFERAEAAAARAGDAARVQEASSRAAALRDRRSTIVVRTPPLLDLRVLVDGKAVQEGQRVPVDGGEHEIVVTAHCRERFDTHMTVAPRDDAKGIDVRLVPSDPSTCRVAEALAQPVTEPPAPTPKPQGFTAAQKIGFGLSAFGGAFLVGGVVLLATRSRDARSSDESRARAETFGELGIFSGALMLTCGTVLYFAAPGTIASQAWWGAPAFGGWAR